MSTKKSQSSLFPSLEPGNFDEEEMEKLSELSEYNQLYLADIEDMADEDDQYGHPIIPPYEGRPIMTNPDQYTFTDENDKEKTQNYFKLFVIDDNEQEYLEIKVNLKKEGNIQTNIRKGSVLFDFLASLRERESPGSMEGFNMFTRVDLSEIKKWIDNLGSITVKVLHRRGRFDFYSFIVKDAKGKF